MNNKSAEHCSCGKPISGDNPVRYRGEYLNYRGEHEPVIIGACCPKQPSLDDMQEMPWEERKR